MAPSDRKVTAFPAGLSLGTRLKCTLQDLHLFSESHIYSIYIFSCYLEQFITGIPSSVAAIPLQCLHQTRLWLFCLLFACTSSCLSRHFGLLQTLPPSMWSIPNPLGAGRDCTGWDGWGRWPQSPSRRAVCGFGPFSFQLLFHKSFNPVGCPCGIPSTRSQWRGWLSPGSSQLQLLQIPPCTHLDSQVPQVSQPWGGGSCPAQLRGATFSLLSSGKIHVLTSGQGHLKSHGTWTLLKAEKCTMAGEERNSKGHLCCNLGERWGDCQMWIIPSCWE